MIQIALEKPGHFVAIEGPSPSQAPGEALRAGRANERRAGPAERADVREDGVLLPPVEEGRRRIRARAKTAVVRGALRVLIRRGAQRLRTYLTGWM